MQELHRREELVYNPKTRQTEPIVVLMVRNRAGRYLTIWAGRDESGFPGSAAGKAWAAGEPLPLKVVKEMTPARLEALRKVQAARHRQDRR